MNKLIELTIACAFCIFIQVQAEPSYRLESAVTLKSAAPDWDYLTLDNKTGYLYIGRRGEGALVYNTKKRRVVKTLEHTDAANAIVLVPEFDRGYSINGDGSATAFQMSTLKYLGRIKLGQDADSGFYDPFTKQIAFTMGEERTVIFANAKNGEITGTLKMQSNKLDGTVANGEGQLFMALRDRNAVVQIDVATRTVLKEWKTVGCDEPTALSYDKGHNRLFVGCRGKAPVLAIMDSITGDVLSTHEIGRGNDGVIFDSVTHKIFTSNGVDANLVIYEQMDPNSYQFSSAITTRPYARTMAYDTKNRKIYMVTAEGMADPSNKINKAAAPFYPNKYFADTFTVLTYAIK